MLQSRVLDIIKLILFASLQVLILNNINFMGFADPYVYILFILFLPLDRNKYLVLFYAFLIGLVVDFFENTGGINAFVSVFVAYLRLPLINLLQSNSALNDQDPKLTDFSFFQWVIYLVLLVFFQHFIIDLLQTFSLSQWDVILERSAIGAALTLVLCALFLAIFPMGKNKEF